MSHLGEQRLERYVLDELDVAQRLEVERHLASCSRCAERVRRERRLDELLSFSLPVTAPGAAERSLERLFADIDRASGPEAPAGRPDAGHPPTGREVVRPTASRRAALTLWWPAAAAVLVLGLLPWLVDDGPKPQDDAGHGALVGADTAAPADMPLPPMPDGARTGRPVDEPRAGASDVARVGLPGDPLDRERLDAVRAALATALLDARQRGVAFGDGQLSAWRQDGWPVASLLRGLAREADHPAADAALAWSVGEPAAWGALASALTQPERVDLVLELLSRDPAPLDGSLALQRQVERLAEQDDRALGLLARAEGARAQAALERLARRRWDGTPEVAATLLPRLPVTLAAELLLDQPRAELSPAFDGLVARDRAAIVAVARRLLSRGRTPPLAWLRQHRLSELAPELVARLEDAPEDADLLATVVDLGGPQTALSLHGLWESESGASAHGVAAGLAELIGRDRSARDALAAALARRASDAALELAEALPSSRRGPWLLACLRARPDDGGGHRELLVAGIARLGSTADGEALLAWLDESGPGSTLAALTWSAAAGLAPEAAEAAWSARGGDPALLARAAERAGRRFAVAGLPAPRTLRPLSESPALDPALR